MSKSSIVALKNQIESGKLLSNSAYILQYIKLASEKGRGVDMLSLEGYFDMKQSTITSRVSDLEDKGLIYTSGTRKKINGNGKEYSYSLFYYEANEFKQAENRQKRHFMKFEQIVTRLQKEFPELMSKALKIELNNSLNFQMDLFDE